MADARGDEGMHFALPPAHCDLSLLNEQQQSAIAEELQPQLLTYRLRDFDRVRHFSASKHSSTFAGTEVARSLAASVLGEPEILEPAALPHGQPARSQRVGSKPATITPI